MDADGLPLVGPGIDLTKVGAIHQKRTVAFLNHFITNTVRFMNHFSCVCEEKLADVAIKIQRLETAMSILESKLSSIPGLENVTVATTDTSQGQAQVEKSDGAHAAAAEVNGTVQVTEPEAAGAAAPPPAEEIPQNTASQDPRYAKYFKMLRFGVGPLAVKQKIAAEGLNPDYLDNPNAVMETSGTPQSDQQELQSDSESDFSDEKEQGGGSDTDSTVEFSD